MREVFVDTGFWIARLSLRDNLHQAALAWEKRCSANPLVTTDSVLSELLTFFAERGPELRKASSALVSQIESNPNVALLRDGEYVKAARQLYGSRLDKGYSMVDCISMVVMKSRRIELALTADKHFSQEGFAALLLLEPTSVVSGLE
jgi:uncharacterized protein